MNLTPQEEKRYNELCNIALDFARGNKKDELEKMIKAGFNPNFKDHKGNSLLMLACYHGGYETAKMLISSGAKVDEKNDKGQTPLAGVCFKGYFQIVKLLVENNANIDENNGLGMTPYSFAVMFGHKDIANYLAHNSKKSFLKKLSLKILNLFK